MGSPRANKTRQRTPSIVVIVRYGELHSDDESLYTVGPFPDGESAGRAGDLERRRLIGEGEDSGDIRITLSAMRRPA